MRVLFRSGGSGTTCPRQWVRSATAPDRAPASATDFRTIAGRRECRPPGRAAATAPSRHVFQRVHIVVGKAEMMRSEEHTSELQSLMRISYAVFCLKKKNIKHTT